MGYLNKAIKSTFIVFTVSIFAALFGYLIRIYLARNLTTSEYGLFFSVFTLINLISLLKHFGLGSALIKYIPEFQIKKNFQRITESIYFVFIFNIISSLILVILVFATSDILAKYYFKNVLAGPVLIFFCMIIIFSTFKQILRHIFNAFQSMFNFSLMYFFENFLVLLFLPFLFYFNLGIFSPIISYILSYLIIFLIFFPIFLKIFPLFNYQFKFSKELVRKLFSFGFPLVLSSVGSIIILYTDTLVLTYFMPLKDVGIYNVVVPTAMLLSFFGTAVTQVIFPMGSEMWSKGLKLYFSKAANMLQKYSFLVITPIMLIIFSFSEILLRLFFGEPYVVGSSTLKLLVIGVSFFVLAGINMTLFSSMGQPKINTKIMFIGATFNILTNFYFIPRYGIFGAGLTSLLSYFLILSLSIFYLNRLIKLKIPWISWLKTCFSGFMMVLSLYILKDILELNQYFEAAICIIFAGFVYLLLNLLLKNIKFDKIKDFLIKNKI